MKDIKIVKKNNTVSRSEILIKEFENIYHDDTGNINIRV